VRLVDGDTDKIIAGEVELADSFWRRFRGLMFRRRFPPGKALFFKFNKPGCRGVHMYFVWFPIDLVYLDSSFNVVEVRARLKPWRVYWPKAVAKYLIELPARAVTRVQVSIGHKILLEGKVFNP
jgi:uncharacterized membrane protein (UPF0127 family)